jgi:signal transduction histidine kinase
MRRQRSARGGTAIGPGHPLGVRGVARREVSGRAGLSYGSPVSWAGSLLAWIQRRRAPVGDGLLAAAVTVMVLVDLASPTDAVGVRRTDAVAVVLSLLQTLPLAFRRRAPLPAFVLTLVGVCSYYSLGYEVTDGTLATFVGVYTVAAYEDRRTSLLGLGLLAVGMTWYWLARAEPFDPTTPIWIGILGLLSWGLGEYVRTRRAYTAEVEALAERLDRARALEARQAVWQERARLARELHDVIGHTVNVMVIQAGAGRRTLASDRALAERAFQTIESTGREALDELDRLLGILRTAEDEPDLPPQPGLEQLPALAGRFEDAGLPVEIAIEGDEVSLPRSLDQSAYRIIQEALTNALRHAGGTVAHVAVRYRTDRLELEVANDGRGKAAAERALESAFGRRSQDSGRQDRRPGRGLIGIRERVALFGGELEAGPRAGGGFVVRCRFPLTAGRP